MCNNFIISLLFVFTSLVIAHCVPDDNRLGSYVGVNVTLDPDEGRDAVQIITSRGFKAETHYVITKDGYILGVHRIVNPRHAVTARKALLLQHGLMGSSTDWLINQPFDDPSDRRVANNLAFLLSQQGYDVWLSNSRGNVYSTNHTTLDIKDKKFWRFTFDEMSGYDLPAVIKHILKTTNSSSIGYIGHSQGTAIMFALLASKPEWAQVIDPFVALAPVAYVGSIESPIRYFADLSTALRVIGGEFLPPNKLVKYIAEEICDQRLRFICSNIMFLMCGFDENQLNMTRLGVYFSHTPAGTSSWDVSHFGQMVRNKRFQKFDYGKRENRIIYGEDTPPEYNLTAITSTKIALIRSSNDWLADPSDVLRLKQSLNVPLMDDYLVPYQRWSHIDFIFGKDAGVYVYPRVLKLLQRTDRSGGK